MTVTIANQTCRDVVVTDNATLGALECVAPPGPGLGDTQLRVSVADSGNGAYRFFYNPPVVHEVEGFICDADVPCPIQVCRR